MVAKLRQIQVRLTTIRDQRQRTTKIAIGEQRLTTIRDQGQSIGGQARADFVHTMQTMQTFQTLQDHRK
jgi:hypothetical protein